MLMAHCQPGNGGLLLGGPLAAYMGDRCTKINGWLVLIRSAYPNAGLYLALACVSISAWR